MSFRQADLLAKSFQSRIASKQSQFREAEYRAHSNRPHYGHAIQSLQSAFLIAQTREDHGSLMPRKTHCQLFSLLAAAGPRISVAQIGLVLSQNPDCFLCFPLAQQGAAETYVPVLVVRRQLI